ncbi:MAG: hypothetical protein H6735_00655 [Alphaproteobacteria bacterium]|nr:hypothetical protein [Alphaproteobacteria bacterium]
MGGTDPWSRRSAPEQTLGQLEEDPDGFWFYLWDHTTARPVRIEVRREHLFVRGPGDRELRIHLDRLARGVIEERGDRTWMWALRLNGGREALGTYTHEGQRPEERERCAAQLRWIADAIGARARRVRGQEVPAPDPEPPAVPTAAPPPERLAMSRHPWTRWALWAYVLVALASIGAAQLGWVGGSRIVAVLVLASLALGASALLPRRSVVIDRIGVDPGTGRRIPWSTIRDIRLEVGEEGARAVLLTTDAATVPLDTRERAEHVVDELNRRRPLPSTDPSVVPEELRRLAGRGRATE